MKIEIRGHTLELKKVQPDMWQHSTYDKRQATRYAVYLGGRKLGEVYSRSEESWAKTGRIRTSFLGYSRSWGAIAEGERRPATNYAYSRAIALEELVRATLPAS
jgi:hypothetical protein